MKINDKRKSIRRFSSTNEHRSLPSLQLDPQFINDETSSINFIQNRTFSSMINTTETGPVPMDDDENLALLNSDNGSQVIIRSRKSMSWIMAAGLIVNAAMGAGLLNLAKAYDDAGGIAISSIIHAIVVLLVMGAYAILFVCCDQSTPSFEIFVLMKCGRIWQKISSVCIILYMYGLSITFFIIIGDQLDRCFYQIDSKRFCDHVWYFNRQFTIPISSFIFILPFCFSKSIKFLQIPSMLGVFAIIYVVFVVPIEYFQMRPKDVQMKTSPNSWTDIFSVIPTICFCYQAHVNAVPVFVSMRSRADCIKATIASTIVLILSYCFVAICGYLTFGTSVDHDILMSYKTIPTPVLIAIIMVAIKTYSAYPVNLFCGRTAIDSLSYQTSDSLITTDPRHSLKRRILIVSIWFGTTLVAAVFLPNISVAIHYLGALAASFIFIFPGLCLFFHVEQSWINSWSNYFSIGIAIFYVAIGVFITALTLVQSLISDISGKGTTSRNPCEK